MEIGKVFPLGLRVLLTKVGVDCGHQQGGFWVNRNVLYLDGEGIAWVNACLKTDRSL